MGTSAKLIFFCGKMAAGKSTLARELADRENAILFVQDDLLEALFPGEITDIQAFVQCCSRLKNALTPYICALLSKRISVVLDFAAATKGNIRALDQLLVPAGRDVRHRGSAECGSGSCAGHDNLHHSCDSDRPPSHLNQHCECYRVSSSWTLRSHVIIRPVDCVRLHYGKHAHDARH